MIDFKRMDETFKKVIERSNKPVMSAKEAAEALGTTSEAIMNAAEGNHLPFGFIVSRPDAYKRTVLINRRKLYDWYTGGREL